MRPANGEPSFETMVRHKFWMVGLRPRNGDILEVKYDPKTQEAAFVLDGDVRYDLELFEANTEQRRLDLADMKQQIADDGGMVARVAAAKAAKAAADPIEQMERLVKLRDSGALTAEEFEKQKARILG